MKGITNRDAIGLSGAPPVYQGTTGLSGPVEAVDAELHSAHLNPRPDTVFRHLRSDRGGGGWCDPPPHGVSKRSVVELSRKNQQIALAEYSRLVVLFLILGQYLTQLWQVKGQIFANSMTFQLYKPISAKLSIVAAWDLHQRVPRSIMHKMKCFDASQSNI